MSAIITSIVIILSIFFLLPYLYFLPKVSGSGTVIELDLIAGNTGGHHCFGCLR